MKNAIVGQSGGPTSVINSSLAGVYESALERGAPIVYGMLNGIKGFLEKRVVDLSLYFKNSLDIESLKRTPSSFLGSCRYKLPDPDDINNKDLYDFIFDYLNELNVGYFFYIGGNDSMDSIAKLSNYGKKINSDIKFIGVPKTIDNDVPATDTTFGFYTAVEIATEAIDRIKTTAESHGRVLILEVMGRYAGWIALAAGIAGGADTILIPEIPYDLNAVVNKIKQRKEKRGKNYSVIVVAEGAKPIGGDMIVKATVGDSPDSIRLGGAGEYVAKEIEKLTGKEARSTTLGYIQRGGNTGPYDRILSTELGSMAMQLAIEEKFDEMVTLLNGKITHVSLDEVAGKDTKIGEKSSNIKRVDLEGDLVQTARRIGICLGDM